MKVQVIRPLKEDSTNKSGIGYYADFLEEHLKTEGYDVKTVCFDLNLNKGFVNAFIHNIGRPIISLIRNRKNVDVVHATAEHCAIFLPFSKAKKIVTFHHVMKGSESNTIRWNAMLHMSVIISKIYADEFIAISPLTKEDMINILNIPEKKITVAMYPPKSEMYVENIVKEDMVSFVGSLIDRKNPSAAVMVFKKMLELSEFKNYRLIFCGHGPELDTIKRLVLELGLNDVVDFKSNLSVEELRSLYGRCRFLLNTSRFEGLGLTTLEAQMCGTPVLYFKDAEIPHEVMVAAVPCNDVDDMARKAFELIRDEDQIKKVIEDGIEYANNFGKDYNKSLKTVYKRNNKGAPKTP